MSAELSPMPKARSPGTSPGPSGFSPTTQRLAATSPSKAHLDSSGYLVFGARGGKFSTAKPKSDVDWKVYRAQQVPGPGEYALSGAAALRGGRISKAKPKTDVEWAMMRSKDIPAPGDYDVAPFPSKGGKFSTAHPKSDLDWKIYRAQQTPGPGAYQPDLARRINGGRLSTAKVMNDVDWAIYRAKRLPGPGQYHTDSILKKQTGGRFSTANPKTDVEWRIYQAKQQPGPGDYELDHNHKLLGGRISNCKPKSELDFQLLRAARTPGPGEYDGEITSIAKRTGLLPFRPRTPSVPASKPSLSNTIPKEARGTPKPKDSKNNASTQQAEPTPKRPHTSMGLPPVSANHSQTTRSRVGLGTARPRSLSPNQWKIPAGAARAYGLTAPPKRKGVKKPKKPMTISVKLQSEGVPTSNPEPSDQGDAARGPGSLKSKKGLRSKGSDSTRVVMSENAQQLFDMAMQSDEFRQMMQLYTGLEDPTAIIEKYASMWSANPLQTESQSRNRS